VGLIRSPTAERPVGRSSVRRGGTTAYGRAQGRARRPCAGLCVTCSRGSSPQRRRCGASYGVTSSRVAPSRQGLHRRLRLCAPSFRTAPRSLIVRTSRSRCGPSFEGSPPDLPGATVCTSPGGTGPADVYVKVRANAAQFVVGSGVNPPAYPPSCYASVKSASSSIGDSGVACQPPEESQSDSPTLPAHVARLTRCKSISSRARLPALPPTPFPPLLQAARHRRGGIGLATARPNACDAGRGQARSPPSPLPLPPLVQGEAGRTDVPLDGHRAGLSSCYARHATTGCRRATRRVWVDVRRDVTVTSQQQVVAKAACVRVALSFTIGGRGGHGSAQGLTVGVSLCNAPCAHVTARAVVGTPHARPLPVPRCAAWPRAARHPRALPLLPPHSQHIEQHKGLCC